MESDPIDSAFVTITTPTNAAVPNGNDFCSCKIVIHYIPVNKGRFKSCVIDSSNYLLLCYRYIELNSARATIISHPSEYPWSSYAVNALGTNDERGLLVPHNEYLLLNADASKRQASYRALFKTRSSKKTLEDIRESTNKS